MAIRDVYVAGSNGVGYTKEVTSSADYAALPNDTYFKDLSLGVGGLVLYKDPSGNVLSIFTQANPGTVTSVGLSMPSAFSVANSPVTGSGSIAVTGAGTTTEYVRGDGSLATFPTVLSSDVIIQEVKLGEPIATGKAVYVYTADGTNIIVRKASNATEATSSKTLGLLVAGGATNLQTQVVTNGKLGGLDTSMATIGNAVWLGVDGELLYGLPNKPVAPAHLVYIGVVTRVNSNNGEIFVSIQNGFEVDELHDVTVVGRVNDSLLGYNSSTDLHEFKTVSGWLGYTPANVAGQVFTGAISATNLSGTNTGDETNTTIKTKLGAATSSNDGYLTSTDWTSFNSKVASSLLGVSNGVATLDAGGKIPAAQLPSSIMNYHGTYDILTNTPALSDGMVGADPGDVYICTTAGTRTFGPGNTITVGLGDWLIYSQTSIWEKSDNSDSVVSVNGYTGVVSLGVSDISGAVGGSGITNYLTKFTGTNTIDVNSLLYDTGSRIGLGITGPTALFHINNTSTADSFKVEDESNPDASPFVIDTDGKVGIGIGTPTAPLHVNVIASPSTGETLANFTVSDDLNSGLKIINNTGTDGRFTPNIYSTGNHPQSALVITGNTLDDNGTIPITIFDSRKNGVTEVLARPLFSWRNYGTPVMQINANGKLGIGTITPTTKLHVVGDAMVDTAGTTSLRVNNTLITSTDTTGVTGIYLGDAGSGVNMIQREKHTANSAGINLYAEYGYNTQSLVAKFQYNLAKMYTAGVQRFYLDGNGNVSIGDNINPSAKLHINNTSTSASFLVEDSNNPDTTPFIIDANGNVGIGIANPTNPLHIRKTASSVLLDGLRIERDPSLLSSAIFNAYEGGTNIISNSGVTNAFNPITFRLSDNTTTNEVLRISSDGNVGVGITTPTARVHINHIGEYDAFRVDDDANPDVSPFVIDKDGNVGIGNPSPGGTAAKVTIQSSDTEGTVRLGGGNGAGNARLFLQSSATDAYIDMYGDNQYLPLRIDAGPLRLNSTAGSGNVGIGTSTPLAKLHVNATAIPSTDEPIAYFTVSDDSSSYLRVLNGTGGNNAFVPTFEGKQGAAQEALYFIGNGTTDTGNLPVVLFDGRIGTSAVVTRPLFKWTNLGVDKMTMTGNGNLGIGTSIPNYKLEVNGDLKVSTIDNATTNTGKILVSDNGVVKYRTAAETISDILTVTTTGSSGPATLTGTTLNIPQYTGGTGTFDYGVAYAMSTQNFIL